MIYYCIQTENGVSFPMPIPRVVVFIGSTGKQHSVTRPTITDLDGHGYFDGNRYRADKPAELRAGEKYGSTTLVDGVGVVDVVQFTEAEQIAARLELCQQIQAAAGLASGRKFTAGTKPQRDSVTNADTLEQAQLLAQIAIDDLASQ